MTSANWFSRSAEEASELAVSATGLIHKFCIQDPQAPLFLMVHGRAGNRNVMWTFTHSLPTTVNLLFPQAPFADLHDGGFSWWLKGAMNSDTIEAARQTLTRFLSASIEHYQLKPRRIIGIGFSQGAGILSVVMQEQPDLLAGLALMAGFVLERPAVPSPSSEHPRTKVFMAHGSDDTIVRLEVARSGADYLIAQGYEVEFVTDPVEHKVGKTGMRGLRVWAKTIAEC